MALVSPLRKQYSFVTESKKSCVHLMAGSSAFVDIRPRSTGLRLDIILSYALESPRVAKIDQVSKNRFLNEIDLSRLEEVDAELIGWAGEAYLRASAA